jgi:hypothetical protein
LPVIRAKGEYAQFRDDLSAAGLPTTAPPQFVTREPLPWAVAP